MTSVGIREFKTHLSRYVRRIKNGEALALTDHGKEIVIMTPSTVDRDKAMWDLVRRGVIKWNGGRANFRNRKLLKIKGKPLSETVVEMRREERY